jgi:FkbM family methyltransferase
MGARARSIHTRHQRQPCPSCVRERAGREDMVRPVVMALLITLAVAWRLYANPFYSERGQDHWVSSHLFWGVQPGSGFFVEFGARDGIAHSNTAYFERTLGWRGLCVEPLQTEFAALVANRPRCHCVHGAIAARRAMQDFVIVDGKLGWNGFWDSMNPHRQRQLVKMNRSGEVRLRTVRTQTYTLNELLREAQPRVIRPRVHLLSIDTEGNELSVLESLDWSLIDVDVVQVEKADRKEAINALMAQRGFVRRRDAKLQDSIYVRAGFDAQARPWWAIRCLPFC